MSFTANEKEAKISEIKKHVEAGASIYKACQMAKVGYSTYAFWNKKKTTRAKPKLITLTVSENTTEWVILCNIKSAPDLLSQLQGGAK